MQRTGGAKPNVIQAAAVALFVLGACCAPAGPDKDADPAGVLPISVAAEPTSDISGAAASTGATGMVAGFDTSPDCGPLAAMPAGDSTGCPESDAGAKDPAASTPEFDFEDVRLKARRLSELDYSPGDDLPKRAWELDYDQYRRIQNRPSATIWPESANGFRALLDPAATCSRAR